MGTFSFLTLELLPPSLKHLFSLGSQYRPGSPDLDTTDVLIDAFQPFAHKFAPQGGVAIWFNAMRTNGKDQLYVAQSFRANAASFLSEALREAKIWSKVFTFIPANNFRRCLLWPMTRT